MSDMMKTYTKEELAAVLTAHSLWRQGMSDTWHVIGEGRLYYVKGGRHAYSL